MLRIKARSLLAFKTDSLWERLIGEFILVFDDGVEIATNARETIYSHFLWEYHKRYEKTPLNVNHHVRSVLGTKLLSANTHIDLFANIVWDTFRAYKETHKEPQDFINELSLLMYQISSDLYNELLYNIEDCVMSMDIVDFIQIMQAEEIKKTLDDIQPTQNSIDNAYTVIKRVMKEDMSLRNNPIVKSVKAGLIKQNQLLQCIGPRGYLTDIDSNLFPTPITRGYVKGIRSLHDSIIESRSASKALYFSKADLQNAEYFSRKLQLLCQTVKNLHFGDCGSQNYLVWHVEAPTFEDGKQTFAGDLEFLVGKYYLDAQSNTLQAIKVTDKHLEGKTIKIRSVVAGCAHPDPYGICSTCFGELSLNVPKNTNIGQMCSTSLTQKSSQSILSVKHLDGSSSVERIVLSTDDKKFLKVSQSGSSYHLSDSLKNKKIKLYLPASQVLGLTDILEVTDVHKLSMTRVSNLSKIVMFVLYKDYEERIPLEVNIGKRFASLSYAALEYIKHKGWEIDDKDNFIIDLDGWNFNDVLLTLPIRHFNMSDVTQSIAKVIESNMASVNSKEDSKDPEAVLLELYELVTKHLHVNLAVLEVTLLGAMCVSPENLDFRIPKANTTRFVGASKQTTRNRSLSAAMAYEKQRDTIVDPNSYFKQNRPNHQMDVFLCPHETVLAQG